MFVCQPLFASTHERTTRIWEYLRVLRRFHTLHQGVVRMRIALALCTMGGGVYQFKDCSL